MSEPRDLILWLADYYREPVFFEDKRPNKIITIAVEWAEKKLSGKTKKDLFCFRDRMLEAFQKTSYKNFPDMHEMNLVFDVCFRREQESERTYIMLNDLRPKFSINIDVAPEPFNFLKYLQDEAALTLTKGSKISNDILFKKYGMEGLKKVAKWKGEYNYDNCVQTVDSGAVDWIEVYRERPPA